MKKLIALSTLTLLSACATHQIVERADDLSFKPDWTELSKSSYERDGKMYFTAFIEVDGSSSKGAALNMSDEKALSEPMRAISEAFLDQNQVGEELRKDDMFGRRIISATKGYRPPMASLRISKRYWETVAQGDHSLELRAYSLAEISIADFEAAKRAYERRLAGDPEVKKILDDVGAKQRDKVMDEPSAKQETKGDIKSPHASNDYQPETKQTSSNSNTPSVSVPTTPVSISAPSIPAQETPQQAAANQALETLEQKAMQKAEEKINPVLHNAVATASDYGFDVKKISQPLVKQLENVLR